MLELNRRGYGFVDTDEGTFFIPASRIGGAMHGDHVEVRPYHSDQQEGQRRTGAISHILDRATEYVVGKLEISDPLAVVVAQDPRIQHDIFVTLDECPQARDGDMVLARITTYPTRRIAAQGYIVEVVGQADTPGMDVDILIHGAGLPTEFSPQALAEAAEIEPAIEEALQEHGRRDLREREVFTIDPVDAKDFDDAVSIDSVEGLTRLGVHIADVTSYVPWDGSIDICARDRATSAYLVDRVLPMLPEKLCNDVCSLRPGQDRRTITCDMFLDEDARVVRYEIYPSVICSKRRCTYEEVQEVLDDPDSRDPLRPKFERLHRFACSRIALGHERGALDFDSVEAKPVLDEDGHPIDVALRHKTDATSMIEEAMIAANETVATHLFSKKHPCIYRVHEPPRAVSLETLLPVLKELGYPIEGLGQGDPKAYQAILEAAGKREDKTLVETMVLRSLEQAYYSVEPLGHFGLGLEHYCHFTSPIRRYPDLMVHRLLRDPHAMEGQLEWLAEHSSKMERTVEEVERDTVDLKLCEYMGDHVGEQFEGTIVTILAYGFFVRLKNTAEGLVRFDPVHDEYYLFDPKVQTLTGEESGRTYRLGQTVQVQVEAVEIRERTINFSLA